MKRLTLPILLLTLACNRDRVETAQPLAQSPAGNGERGKMLMSQYGCTVCHVAPGVEGPQGSLGPSLAGLSLRPTISNGTIQNTPANLLQFVQNPGSLNPASAMPPSQLTPDDARDVTAYLMTLK